MRHTASRLTVPNLIVNYKNLGDFGGTDPVMDMWTLEVSGPTFEYKGILSDLGLRWDSARKSWGINATLYKYNTRARAAEWVRARKIQTDAYPKLVELAKEHNDRARAENDKLRPTDMRDKVEVLRRVSRMAPQLEKAGIIIKHIQPGRFEAFEPRVSVSGDTYPIRLLMVKYGFKWNPTRKAWEIPDVEFSVVGDKWMSDVVRGLPDAAPEPAARAVFTEMSEPELTSWVMANIDGENLTDDGETSLAKGVAKYKMRLRRMTPEDQEKFYNAYTSGRRAGVVVPFSPKAPRNTHTVLIAGTKYVLSTHWPGVFGDLTEEIREEEGGARIIRQDDMDPWKYLWVYDTEKQTLAMWRVSDGNNKEWGSARSSTAARTILLLDKKGQLNRVDHTQFQRISSEMDKLEREHEESLERWVEETKDDFQRRVDVLVREYFDKVVRPVMDRAVASVESGAVPIGFKRTEGGFPVERQMKSYVTSRIYNDLFSLDKIDEYVQSRGVDLNSGDIQATQWAQGDVWMEYARSVLR